VPVTTHLTLETVDFNNRAEVDALIQKVMAAGRIRVQADIAKLQAMGLMDSEGKLLNKELPPDMQEGSERDFGG
jgi:hypothetical protein